MAAFVVTETVNRWHGFETSRANYLRALEMGDETARKMLETMVLKLPHFEVKGTTDTNTDTTFLDLTAQGVSFPDGTQRQIYIEASASDNDGHGLALSRGIIDGGATPIASDFSVDVSLDDGLAGAIDVDIEVSTANVVLQVTGISATNMRWHIKVWVYDPIPLAYIATA